MVACRIILSAPVPFPFLWTLDFGFGIWIWDLDLGLGFGTGLGLDNNFSFLNIFLVFWLLLSSKVSLPAPPNSRGELKLYVGHT